MPRDLVILADDLTGACDSAAPFGRTVSPAVVFVSPVAMRAPAANAVAYSTNTRSQDGPVARRIVGELAARVARPEMLLIKKVDSTLLGNIGYEVDAVLDALPRSMAVVATAFPAMGRQVVEGRVRVAGRALERDIRELVRDHTGGICHTIPLCVVRGGDVVLTHVLERQFAEGARWVVVDGECDADLDVVARSLKQLTFNALPVVSGGLTAALARQMVLPGRVDVSQLCADASATRGVVAFVGSANAVTQAQIAEAVRHENILLLDLNDMSALETASALREGRHVVIRVGWQPSDRAHIDAVARVCISGAVAGVIATGGDTAQLVCSAISCTFLQLEDEVVPGIAQSRCGDGLLRNSPFITKAGGFGEANAIVQSIQHLRRLATFRQPITSPRSTLS